jgi:hypothetical protein
MNWKQLFCKHKNTSREGRRLFHELHPPYMIAVEGEYCTNCNMVVWTKEYEIKPESQYYCCICGSRDIEQAINDKKHCRCHSCKASWTVDNWHGSFT